MSRAPARAIKKFKNSNNQHTLCYISRGEPSCVIIDEVQRIPQLLNEVHRLIEKDNIHFLLTGSSARKLRYNQANLLAGRARYAYVNTYLKEEIQAEALVRKLPALTRFLKYSA